MCGQYMTLWQQAKLAYFTVELRLYTNLMDVTRGRINAAQHVLGRRSTSNN